MTSQRTGVVVHDHLVVIGPFDVHQQRHYDGQVVPARVHVVKMDVGRQGLVRVLGPALAVVPQPGGVREDAHAHDELDGDRHTCLDD